MYRSEIVSVFPTIYDAMMHIYVIDCNWLAFLAGGGVTDMSAEYVEELKESTNRFMADTEGKTIEELGGMMSGLSNRFRAFIEIHEDIEAMCPSGEFKARYVDFIQHPSKLRDIPSGEYHGYAEAAGTSRYADGLWLLPLHLEPIMA